MLTKKAPETIKLVAHGKDLKKIEKEVKRKLQGKWDKLVGLAKIGDDLEYSDEKKTLSFENTTTFLDSQFKMYAELEVVPGHQQFSTASYVETIPETTINCPVRYKETVTVLEVNDKEVRAHFRGNHSLAQCPEGKVHEKCQGLELSMSSEHFRVYPTKRSFYPAFSKTNNLDISSTQKGSELIIVTNVIQNGLKTDTFKTIFDQFYS